MAYNFLNTTTYDGEQEGLFNYLANAALTNAGASLSMPDNAEPDLVEITHDDYSAPQSDGTSEEQPDIEEQPNTLDDEFFKEPDDKVDLDLLSSLFDTSEEDNDTLKQQVQELRDKAKVPNRTYHVEDDNGGESDNSHTYLPNGKVAPRIWQYGGQPSKYEVGDILHANDEHTQRIGLNDSNYTEAHFSTSGTNTFRGLDNYQPVYVTDGSKYRILKGPNDTDTFKGKVYEKRLK